MAYGDESRGSFHLKLSISHPHTPTKQKSSASRGTSPFKITKHMIVEKLMSYFYANLTTTTTRGGDSTNGKRANHSEQSSKTQQTERRPPGKRSLTTKDEDSSSKEEDDAPPKRIRKGKAPIELGGTGRKFACPYFKRNPQKYLTRRSCVGPGWDEVRRVKYATLCDTLSMMLIPF